MMPETQDPYRWKMLAVAWLTAFTSALCITSYSPLLNEMRVSLSMSHSEAALLMSLAVLTSSSFQVAGGALSNRIGTRRTILIGSAIIAASQLTTAVVTSFPLEAAFRFLMGLGAGLALLCAVEITARWFPPRELARAMGIQATGWASGNVVGVIIPLPLELNFGLDWRGPFLAFGAFATVVTLILVALVKEKSRTQTRTRTGGNSWTDLAKTKELWLVMVGNFGAMASTTIFMTWLPTILTESGWSPTLAAAVSTMIPLVGIPGNLGGGAFADRLGRRKPVLLMSGVLGALSFALFILTIQTPLVWVVAAVAGWFSYFYIGPLLSTLPGIPEIGPDRSGAAWGIVMTMSSVAGFISPILLAQVREATGSYNLGFPMAAAFCAMLVIPGVLGRETGWKAKQEHKLTTKE